MSVRGCVRGRKEGALQAYMRTRICAQRTAAGGYAAAATDALSPAPAPAAGAWRLGRSVAEGGHDVRPPALPFGGDASWAGHWRDVRDERERDVSGRERDIGRERERRA